MNEPTKETPDAKPPSLGNTLFIGGACIGLGALALLIGLGAIPSGDANPSAMGRLLGAGAGLLFIFAGITIFLRDFSGARNREEIPQSAPLLLRLGGKLMNIALLALFATLCSVIAFGPFFAGGAPADMTQQTGGFGAAIFRILNGAFAIVLWYAVIYLLRSKFRNRGSAAPNP